MEAELKETEIGNKFEIIANTCDHGFKIGDIVTLEKIYKKDKDKYKFVGKDDYWWCCFVDVKRTN